MEIKTTQGFKGSVSKLMSIFRVGVDIVQTGNHQPLMYRCASVGDVVISQDQCEANGGSKQKILNASEERASILR